MRPLRRVLGPIAAALVALSFASCTSDSPTEPSTPPANPRPDPVVAFNVTVTASPTQLVAGDPTPSTITVTVRRSDNGGSPPNGTEIALTTTLGAFGSPAGPQQTTLQLVNGQAQAALFAGAESGVATVRATLDQSSGAANVTIGNPATFFVASVSPSLGGPDGQETVNVLGGGFDSPVRVTFNNAPATVRSVTPTRIQVITPSAVAAGVTVGVGQPAPVNVTVTINVNEVGQQADTLANGFTYALGGTISEPRVFSISPASGTNDGGTRVTILGDGFQAPVQVLFGQGTSAASFNGVEATIESVSSGRIVAVTPAARGFGQNNVNQVVDILVRNLNTGTNTVATEFFKYGNDVLITGMGPGAGPYTGGTRVTLSGQGFDEPVAVSLGGIGQPVLSVTGTQVVFLTAGVLVTECPADGIVEAVGVSVTNLETGDSDDADLQFNYLVPLPQIFGISPTSGGPGAAATITGRNFAPNVQVLFGDPASGSSAPVTGVTATTIGIIVPNAPQGFTFITEPCDGNGDGIPNGTRLSPTPISVTVRNLDGTGCVTTLSNAFVLNPPNTTCTGDTSTPPVLPQCSDGVDNDGDTFIDFPADPQCANAADNDESS